MHQVRPRLQGGFGRGRELLRPKLIPPILWDEPMPMKVLDLGKSRPRLSQVLDQESAPGTIKHIELRLCEVLQT